MSKRERETIEIFVYFNKSVPERVTANATAQRWRMNYMECKATQKLTLRIKPVSSSNADCNRKKLKGKHGANRKHRQQIARQIGGKNVVRFEGFFCCLQLLAYLNHVRYRKKWLIVNIYVCSYRLHFCRYYTQTKRACNLNVDVQFPVRWQQRKWREKGK